MLKKVKNKFNRMNRKRGEKKSIKNQVEKNYINYNINNETKERLGLDKKGSKGNSGPYEADTLTTNEITGHFNENKEIQ